MPTLLIVDDEPNVRRSLSLALELEGFETRTAESCNAALELLDGVDLVLTDMSMPGRSGLELLLEIRRRQPRLPVAIMTAYASVDGALQAMQQGAYDYLLKPCHTDEIILKVNLGLKLSRYENELRQRNEALERLTAELAEKNAELLRLATTDPLTQIANRRRFMERLTLATAEAERYGHAISVAMIDIDHFKRINDTHGHPTGDAVLVETAARLAQRLRTTDLLGRLGGEEFAALLTNTDADGAKSIAESLRAAIADDPFDAVGPVTISVGVATGAHERLLANADAALYEAKTGGRNRVAVYKSTT